MCGNKRCVTGNKQVYYDNKALRYGNKLVYYENKEIRYGSKPVHYAGNKQAYTGIKLFINISILVHRLKWTGISYHSNYISSGAFIPNSRSDSFKTIAVHVISAILYADICIRKHFDIAVK